MLVLQITGVEHSVCLAWEEYLNSLFVEDSGSENLNEEDMSSQGIVATQCDDAVCEK